MAVPAVPFSTNTSKTTLILCLTVQVVKIGSRGNTNLPIVGDCRLSILPITSKESCDQKSGKWDDAAKKCRPKE